MGIVIFNLIIYQIDSSVGRYFEQTGLPFISWPGVSSILGNFVSLFEDFFDLAVLPDVADLPDLADVFDFWDAPSSIFGLRDLDDLPDFLDR